MEGDGVEDTELQRAEDERFMRLALEQAERAAEHGEAPIGAVVVCDGEVVAAAHNRREIDEDPSAHAEFSAMVEASRKLGRWRLFGCTVYVTAVHLSLHRMSNFPSMWCW